MSTTSSSHGRLPLFRHCPHCGALVVGARRARTHCPRAATRPPARFCGICGQQCETAVEARLHCLGGRLIVSRHPAAIQFIRMFPGWEHVQAAQSVTADQVSGRLVAGNLPLHLAAIAREVWSVEFRGAPPRGAEYTLQEMLAAGAVLRRYKVRALGEVPLIDHKSLERRNSPNQPESAEKSEMQGKT